MPKTGVTPAEAIVQHIIHQGKNGGSTFGEDMDKIKVTGTAMSPGPTKEDPDALEHERTAQEELKRLQAKYGTLTNKKGDKILRLIWPDVINPRLPATFAEIPWKDVSFDGLDVGTFDYGTSNGAAITQ